MLNVTRLPELDQVMIVILSILMAVTSSTTCICVYPASAR